MTTQISKTKSEIVVQIRELAESCFLLAVSVGYFGGFDSDMLRVERVLLAGSLELSKLAEGVE